ncbi:MAG: hypothetical protein DRJ98_07225 [Thermoprotei archaeon]|nr:MAG: hypothetical protein DRJ98_07225 [Thermoprotei archaeon]
MYTFKFISVKHIGLCSFNLPKMTGVLSTPLLFRIRGIYSTALTKLLISRGFYPTQCSETIMSRFKLEKLVEPPDIDIYDLPSKEGVTLEGKAEGIKKITELLVEELPDVIVRELKPCVNAVYKGVAEKKVDEGCWVNLGEDKGLLPKHHLSPGQEVLVTVVKCLPNKPILSLGLRVVGRYAKLLPGQEITLSAGIKKRGKAMELLALGRMIKPEGWGLRWRRSAQYASMEELMREVEELKHRAEEALKIAEQQQAPSLIFEGDKVAELMFPGGSQKKLDELRSEVCTTIPRHHLFKTWGKPYSLTVDLLEALNEALSRENFVKASDYMFKKAIKPGRFMEIIHIKPDGRAYSLRPGKTIEVKNGEVMVERRFKGGGVYDGLGEVKEEGDYGITLFKEGCWVSRTVYYSRNMVLKGVYYNISTPPEIKPGKIKYVDLCIDVVWSPKQGVKVIDEEELKEMVKKRSLTVKVGEKALNIAYCLAEELSRVEDKIVDLSKFNI